MVKKTKKPKESGEEEATKETDNNEGGKAEKAESGNEEIQENKNKEETVKEGEDVESSYRKLHVNMPEGESRTVVRKDTVGSRRAPGTDTTSQEQESVSSAKDEEAPVSETGKCSLARQAASQPAINEIKIKLNAMKPVLFSPQVYGYHRGKIHLQLIKNQLTETQARLR